MFDASKKREEDLTGSVSETDAASAVVLTDEEIEEMQAAQAKAEGGEVDEEAEAPEGEDQ